MANDVEIRIGADASAVQPGVAPATQALDNLGKQTEQTNQRLNNANRRAAETNDAFGRLGARFGLTANEAKNMSFQLNDVAVSLASGMNPMMVFMQQGAQIGQILSTSQGGVGGALAGLRGLFPPVLLGFGAIASVLGVVAVATFQYIDAQRELERASLGAARSQGLTRDALREAAAEGARAGDISVRSAETQAAAYARTGRIGQEMMTDLIGISRDYSVAMGVDAARATQDLGRAFSDPTAGARTLTESLGILSAEQLHQIETMQRQGDLLGAQRVLFEALQPAISGSADQLDGFAGSWHRVATGISNAWNWLGEFNTRMAYLQTFGVLDFFGNMFGRTTAEDMARINQRASQATTEIRGWIAQHNRGTIAARNMADALNPAAARTRTIRENIDGITAAFRRGEISAAEYGAAVTAGMGDLLQLGGARRGRQGRRRRGTGDATDMAEYQAELSQMLAAEQNWGRDALEVSLEFWRGKLSRHRAGSREHVAITRLIAELERDVFDRQNDAFAEAMEDQRRLALDVAQERADAARAVAEAEGAEAREAIQRQLDEVDALEQAGQMRSDVALGHRRRLHQQLRDLEIEQAQRELEIALETLRAQLAAYATQPEEQDRINRQIEQAQMQHAARMRQIAARQATEIQRENRAAADDARRRWENNVGPIVSSFARIGQGLAMRQLTWKEAWNALVTDMAGRFTAWAARMVTQWIAAEAAKTAATATGEGTRTAITAAGAARSLAISAATSIKEIAMYAVKAAAGAYAAIAGIPYVGPFLAPVMAAAALAGVLALGKSIFSAEGGWGEVPFDGAQTVLHKREMVLPANIAVPLRSAIAAGDFDGGGGSGRRRGFGFRDVVIQAADAQSFVSMIRRNRGGLIDMLIEAMRLRLGGTAG